MCGVSFRNAGSSRARWRSVLSHWMMPMRWLTMLLACSFFLFSGDMEGCRTVVERALELHPNHAWALGGLGCYYSFRGQLPGAIAALNKAMRASPHDPLTWAFIARGTQGRIVGMIVIRRLNCGPSLARMPKSGLALNRSANVGQPFKTALLTRCGRRHAAI
jgi:hypothetical protein